MEEGGNSYDIKYVRVSMRLEVGDNREDTFLVLS